MFQATIKVAQQLLRYTDDRAHDTEHARRVAENAVLVGRRVDYPNLELLELCGWWHDVGRTIKDDGHEKLSAELLVRELTRQSIDTTTIRNAYNAIAFHKWNMEPKTLEGNIVRDADKLDFISVERWRSCLDNNQLEHLRDIDALLGQLPQLLKLEETKKIYRQRQPLFIESGLSDLI